MRASAVIKSFRSLLLGSALLLAATGCAQDQASNAGQNHYAARTQRMGSNIPQPYDASADRGGDSITNANNVQQLGQQGNTVGAMQGQFSGGR